MSTPALVRLARSILPLALFISVLAAAPAAAQAPEPADSLLELRMANGSRMIGRVVAQDEESVTFETIGGEQVQARRRYARLRPVRGRVVDGEFWAADRHTTRLFFAPTGRTLPEGAGYAGFFLLLPFVGYGATDDVTLAGGLPFAGSLESSPVWVAPKVRAYHAPGVQLSAGAFVIHLPADETACAPDCVAGGDGSSWNGVLYGVGTFGSDDDALHAGAGLTFGGDGTKLPLMVGGERRVSRRNKLVTENWLIPGEGGAASFGVRRLGERWTFDYGLMFLFGEGAEEVPYFPILSFSYAFGGNR